MSVDKQVSSVYIGAYVYKLGGFVAFAGYPVTVPIWNYDFRYNEDFLGASVQNALNGYERGGVLGFRAQASLDLNNSFPSSATIIRSLLNKLPSQYNRLFYPNTGSVSAGTTDVGTKNVVITGGVQIDNTYTGLDLYNSTQDETRRITAYTGSSRVATLDSAIAGWANGNAIQVLVPPSYPTIVGVSPDADTANIEYFNVTSNTFGIQRELTIGIQSINLELRGVLRKETVPDHLRIL
jgi:hypothetical protein